MNYKLHYEKLIQRGKNRKLYCYKEVHHIIPICLGGTDDKSNLVELTAREHFISHLLLIKIYPNEPGLIFAANMMCVSSKNQTRVHNRMYGWLKEHFSKAQSKQQSGQGNSQFGNMWIYNLVLKKSKTIPKNKVIPQGWTKARKITFEKSPYELGLILIDKEKKAKKKAKKEKNELVYAEYHRIYRKHGWKIFVEMTSYNHSQQNLVARLRQFVPDFIPQNGKKR